MKKKRCSNMSGAWHNNFDHTYVHSYCKIITDVIIYNRIPLKIELRALVC